MQEKSWRAGARIAFGCIALGWLLAPGVWAQGVTTTTVQGTVYLANGQPGAGTLVVSWPAFTTVAGQAIAADSITVNIPADGFVNVNLAPNQGATPAGEYYTAVFDMSDGSTNTEYWVVPAAAQATLAQVLTQVMPAAQAVQAVSKSYVDQAVAEATQSVLSASGGNLTGPLYLNGDPSQPLQAATKHYVDTQVATSVPLAGGAMTGALITPAVNGVQAPAASSSQTTLQAAVKAAGPNGAVEIPPTYSGTDTFTNPNGVPVTDLRTSGAQPASRSVREFGAVCDGVTDDTSALQAALNYANVHNVALTLPQGTCKTHTLTWHGESIGGMGRQVSSVMGFPGQDVLASPTDATNLLANTRLHDFTIYVDQSSDVSCSTAAGRAPAGACQLNRPIEPNSIFSPGGNGLKATAGTGAAWSVGNCAIAMPASTGAGGNGLKTAEIENLAIAATGTDPMAAQYPGAHSTHTCGIYLAQWPQWSEFRNIDIRGLNTGIAIPALSAAPAGLNADSNRWQNITVQATHAFTAAAGSNNVLDNVVAQIGNSAATAEPPTGLVLDFAGSQQGWTVRNAVVLPTWNAVQPALTVTASGGAVTAVGVGSEHGLGWDPYGVTVPLAFSTGCTAQATAAVNSDGSIGAVTVTQGGVGCSSTTTASISTAGTWDTAAPVNLVSGQNMSFFAGNLLKGNGGYTVWNATGSASYGTQLDGGGGTLPGGSSYPALVGSAPMGTTLAVDQFPGVNFGAKLQACVNAVSSSYGGTCDARNFTGNQSISANLTIASSNTTVLLPCATITTASQIVIPAGTRNVALRGCALRGGSAANGSAGGTAFAYSGAGAMIQVGDPTYSVDTSGFHMDNAVINTTAATSATAQAFAAYRTQELDIESLYLLGNANQTGVTLDGTGNYTGGTFLDDEISGFQLAINLIGHQVANPATTDWTNASTFLRLHIDCPTSNGNPIAGTYGIDLQQGDGNTFTGGDVEGCATALHLGSNAQNNTIVGLRNENSTQQVVADAGSRYNNWITGGTMFAGELTDNGTRNSFLDSFHRSFNGVNGDWYGSQQDTTVTNHYRLGTGTGNERGLEDEYQTDYGYRWQVGLGDGTSGEQSYNFTDLLNNVQRLSIGQYLSPTANVVTNAIVNNGGCYTSSTAPTISFSGGGGSGAAATANMAASTSSSCPGGYTVSSVTIASGGSGYTSQPTMTFTGSNQTIAPNTVAEITTAGSTNNQTVINSAGTGAVVLNGSSNAGTGGVIFGSGGSSEATVASIGNTGNAQFNGTLQVGGTTQSAGTMAVRNNADAEVDYYLWPGLTTSQKGSFTYKDWNGSSQWYMLKDASNNWALNSAVGGLDSFKAYQSTNSGDTYIDASNSSGVVRVNYETGAGTGFKIYGGNSSTLYASFTGATSIAFPGLASSSGYSCLQIDSSGYITNTGSACGSGTGDGTINGTIGSSNSGYIAYYTASGSTIGGMSAVPLTAGGTGAVSAAAALANLGALPVTGGTLSGALSGTSASFSGALGAASETVTGPATWCAFSPCPELDMFNAAHSTNSGYTGANFAYKAFTALANTTAYQGFSTNHWHINAQQGGVYNYNTTGGQKTDYMAGLFTGNFATVGEHYGIEADIYCGGSGDCDSGFFNAQSEGGYLSNGDEQTEGLRSEVDQDTIIPAAAVSSVSGNTLTLSSPQNFNYAGESRILANLSSPYNTGTIALYSSDGTNYNGTIDCSNGYPTPAGACLEIVGTGTSWTSVGAAGTTAAMCLGLLANGSTKFCVFGVIESDTTFDILSLEGAGNGEGLQLVNGLAILNYEYVDAWYWAGIPSPAGTSEYTLYPASMVTQIGYSGMAATTVAVMDGTRFASGNSVEEEVAYNQAQTGLRVVLNQAVGLPNTKSGGAVEGCCAESALGTGLTITDIGNSSEPGYQAGIDIAGNFQRAIEVQGNNGGYGDAMLLDTDPGPSGSIIADLATNGNTIGLMSYNNSAGAQRTWTYDRTNDEMCIHGMTACFGGAGGGYNAPISFGDQVNTFSGDQWSFYYNNPSNSGIYLDAGTAPASGNALLAATVNLAPYFEVWNNPSAAGLAPAGWQAIFNEGVSLAGYTGNFGTNTWSIDTATGESRFSTTSGTGSATFIAGSAAGSGASASCASSHTCDSIQGEITLTTGTGDTTGTLLTVTLPYTRTNNATCNVSVVLPGTGVVTGVEWSESTTGFTLTADTTLTTGKAYTVRYLCGGQ